MNVDQRSTRRSPAVLWLIAVSIIYFAIGAFSLGPAYVDFGDGNYLYISQRMVDGLRLYRDIVSPQPPVHLFLGTLLIRIGRTFGNPIYTVRLFLLLLHIGTMALVAGIAHRLFKNNLTTFLSGVLYLSMPIGFWWSRGYQSEGWLIFWLTGVFYLLLPSGSSEDNKSIPLQPNIRQYSFRLMLAGLGCVVALFTNMTALPYVLLFVVSTFFRFRRKAVSFFVPFVLGSLAAFACMMFYSEGAYLENVWSNQVGTYPKDGTLGYFLYKLTGQGVKILQMEGGVLILALLGLTRYLSRSERKERYFVTWYALFSYGSILFVTKGGTMDYIFAIAEPMLAVFAAFFAVGMIKKTRIASRDFWTTPAKAFPALIIIPTLLVAIFFPGLRFELWTLQERSYENSSVGVLSTAKFIEDHSEPGDMILAPAYYAFFTGRVLPEECSSSYIWFMRWFNSEQSGARDADVERFLNTTVNGLRTRKIRVVLLNARQFGKIPAIRNEVEENYRKVTQIQTLNENLEFYLPKN